MNRGTAKGEQNLPTQKEKKEKTEKEKPKTCNTEDPLAVTDPTTCVCQPLSLPPFPPLEK